MKVLLVNPLFDPANPDGTPPLGIATLATAVYEKGYKVKILDLNLDHKTGASVESSVAKSVKYKADVVGLTCWGNMTPFVIEFCRLFKHLQPDVKLVIGGEYASFTSQSILKESKADFVVRGEGEVTFTELLECLERAGEPSQIKGLTYNGPEGIVTTPNRRPLMDMDEMSFVNWGLFEDLASYRGYREFRRLPLQASRGCPFKCIFCSVYKTWGGVQRKKTPRRLIDEINYYVSKFNLKQLHFYDDTFTLDKKWVMEICDLMQKEDISISWQILTRIDLVNEKLLKTLREAGCQSIFYGVESVSPQIQSFIGKIYEESLIDKTIKETMSVGMDPQISVIFGWPIDTPKTVVQLSKFCQRMAKMAVGIHQHLLFPLPGTRLTQEYSSHIIRNPYPKMTQSGLVGLPDEYYAMMERHPEHVPDFWMFKSDAIDPKEVIKVFAETKLAIAEENIRQAMMYHRLGMIR